MTGFTDDDLAPYVDALPRALRGRDQPERWSVLRELRSYAEDGYSPAQVAHFAQATKLPTTITSPAGVLHVRLQRMRRVPSVRAERERRQAERAAALAVDACDHGEPRGCPACSFCRRRTSDVDGVRCERCAPTVTTVQGQLLP